jgi:putative transcriptional regulator
MTEGGSEAARTAGRLLVATPGLGDPNFARTVILMLEHSEAGALGLVLNRTSPLELATALPEWDRFAAPPAHVFVGGPVSHGSVIALARANAPAGSDAWTAFAPDRLPGVGVIDLGKDPYENGVAIEQVRVFSGYAGWGPGQLDGELLEHAWYVVEADGADAFTAAPDELWSAVLRRQDGDLARVSRYPPDPSVN